ncbi:MAG: hypothetical protein IJU44_09440 [Kiritimatiellae bacterium]|nr:hypothetical protein [Kiritimatiellia bacterium]
MSCGLDYGLADHLLELPRADAESFSGVVAALRGFQSAQVSEGFSDRVMAAVKASEKREDRRIYRQFKPVSPWHFLKIAACAILALSALAFLADRWFSSNAVAEKRDVAWLLSAQEPDGSWDPAKHGGSAAYRPALTALSALALAREGGTQCQAAISRACHSLAASQLPSGCFGGTGRQEQYNHAITTFALASLAPQFPEVRPVVAKALEFMRSSQRAAGGWDYVDNSDGNTALTAWNLRALACAEKQGFSEARTLRCRGLRWLRNAVRSEGRVVYHTDSRESESESLTALAAYALLDAGGQYPELERLGRVVAGRLTVAEDSGTDSYRDYAKALAFAAAGESAQSRRVAERLRSTPSATDDDAWGMVGGRLYTSALAILAN